MINALILWGLPLLAFALVVLIAPMAMKGAQKTGLVDVPGGRKHHDQNIPLIGGLLCIPVFIALYTLSGYASHDDYALFGALILLLITGAVDDKRHIRPWIKFSIQFLAAFIIVLGGDARLYTFGNLLGFGDVGLDIFSIPFSVLAVVLLINALNLMDGMDGLCAGASAVMLGWLAYAALVMGQSMDAFPIFILLGTLAGFLVYNMRTPLRKKASIFLGDAGSMCLGLILAWFSIKLAQEEPQQVIQPVAVAWVLIFPVMDAWGQFTRRIREGKHPFEADRGHFHHHLLDAGLPPVLATPVILTLIFLLCAFGIGGEWAGMPHLWLSLLWLAVFTGHIALSNKPALYVLFIQKIMKICG